MTNHPLTNDICEQISRRGVSVTTSIERDNMRAATDWQLEQVIDWLEEHLDAHYVWADLSKSFSPTHQYINVDVFAVINDLKQAMRPTKTQEEN